MDADERDPTGDGPEPTTGPERNTGPKAGPEPGIDFGALTGAGGWSEARPVHPDGTPAPGAFDPRTWWPRFQHRLTEQQRLLEQGIAHGHGRVEAPDPPTPRVSAADLTDLIARDPGARPTSGWRGAVFSASGGRVNPGLSDADAERRELLRRVRRHLPGAHQVAVSSLKGGVGKTTVSAVLGLTLAEHRGDRVVAVDANPDAGTLAERLSGDIGVTVRQMLDNIDGIDSLAAVSHYTSLAGRLQVLASEQDPAMSEAFHRGEYEQICAVLARFFNIIITDSGTGLVHSAMEGTLALADSLVVVGSPTVDGASRASKTLDWLDAHGYAELTHNAVVVLCGDRIGPDVDRDRIRLHFRARARAVLDVPYDPHLATGGRIDLAALRPPAQDAFLRLGALIADRFAG